MPDAIAPLREALADRYRFARELGSGGMATVYLAEDLKHRRAVAIKVLRDDLSEAVGSERFSKEIEIAAGLTHPHIVPLYDSGEAAGFLFYVMPYVEGESLRDRIDREGPLRVADAVQIAREITDALAFAHEQGVVHRDVKPANILLEAGHAVLADFGIAQATAHVDDPRITATGASLGTPLYMSPERASGDQDVDGRSDQYAVACVLYEMLTGEPPFTAATSAGVGAKHLTMTPRPVDAMTPGVPSHVAEAVAKALRKSPDDRFETAHDFLAALGDSLIRTAPGEARFEPSPLALAFLGTLVLGLAVLGVITSSWAPRESEKLTNDLVVVLPFSNETGEPDFDRLEKLVARAITDRLSQLTTQPIASSQWVSSLWTAATTDAARPAGADPRATVVEATSAGIVIGGSISARSDSLVFLAEIAGARGDVGLADIFVPPVVVHRDAAWRALDVLGERLPGALSFLVNPAWTKAAPHLTPVTSISVYDNYSTAYEVFWHPDGLPRSRELLERALAEDPDFTPAEVFLAVVLLNQQDPDGADSLLRQTRPKYDRLFPAEQAQWDWARATLDGDRQRAYGVIRDLMQRFPGEIARFSLGFEALRINRPEEALRTFEALDPDSPALNSAWKYWQYLTRALHVLERHDRELDEAKRGRSRHPDLPLLIIAEIRAHAALGDTAAVASLVEEAIRMDAQPTDVLYAAARELRAHDHAEASIRIGERALSFLWDRSVQVVESPEHRYALLRTLYYLERWREAGSVARDLLRDAPDDERYLGYAGLVAARLSERAKALEYSNRIERIESAWRRPLRTGLRADIAAVLGEHREAVSLLRRAHEEGMYLSIAIHSNMDLEALRDDSEFQEFVKPRG